MTATNHALTGAVIALAVKQPVLAAPLAFLSHYVTDVIPHFNARQTFKRPLPFIGADLITGHILAILLPLTLVSDVSGWLIFACMILAMAPDYDWCWRFLRVMDTDKAFEGKKIWFSSVHERLQWSDTADGFWVELGWAAVMVYLIFQLAD